MPNTTPPQKSRWHAAAASTGEIAVPEIIKDPKSTSDHQRDWDHVVVVFNNDYNTFDAVIAILQKATGCCLEEAAMETWEIHHLGKAAVHYADLPECERVARILRSIGLVVEIREG
ncbi:MAG: ATP-dependent Clp protease adaptor ClpS [Armatimonadetes bacterium]|nr:ATP-dependent Clp protease adaptor ClpS [Armatimonadota bacterium]MDE2207913.1 ATP-dependent Clp protease adaptor ClpS [Armatimonadota bacterium]